MPQKQQTIFIQIKSLFAQSKSAQGYDFQVQLLCVQWKAKKCFEYSHEEEPHP